MEPKRTGRVRQSTVETNAPAHAVASNKPGQYLITVDASTREIVNIEEFTSDGQHRDLPQRDWASLVSGDGVDVMMRAAQDAYTAGPIEGLQLIRGDDTDEDFALLQVIGNRSRVVEPEIRLAIERRLLLRRLLSSRLLETTV